MIAALGLAAREAARRLAQRTTAGRWLWLLLLTPIAMMGAVIFLVVGIIFAVVAVQNAGGCGTTVPVGAPGANIKTGVQVVQYFESQGISANGAAGIAGNLQQESGLNPTTPGGGLAQWLGGRWSALVAYTTSQGLDPNSMAGQLTFLVYDLRTGYATLLGELNSAPDAATAATMFETTYEVCSGVTGYMQVTLGSLCNDPARRTNAVAFLQAAGGASSTVPVSLATGGGCVLSAGGYTNPLAQVVGLSPSRIDMGVDYGGSGPILAIGDGVIVNTAANGWPGLSFIEERLTGGTFAGKCWYYAENIAPTVTVNQVVKAGDQVGILHAGYPWSELGWSTCAGGTTLAASLNEQASGDPGGWTSAAGASASRLQVTVGAPPGISQGAPHGPLPTGYP